MNTLHKALTVTTTLVAVLSCISGQPLGTATALQNGINDDEAKLHGFNQNDGADLTAARGLLQGTPLSEMIPQTRKGAKPDMKAVTKYKNDLVYYLAAKYKDKDYEHKNRIACAIGALGFTKLAGAIIDRMKPVRITKDGDVLVVEAPPRNFEFKAACAKNKSWKYHGDGKDPKFAKYEPYTVRTTGEIKTHVRSVPASDQAKLEEVLTSAFAGRILVVEGETTSFRYLG